MHPALVFSVIDFFDSGETVMTVSALKFHALPSSHAHARERFAASDRLERKLKQTVRGEVRFDAGSRALYATDSSNYRQMPIGLVIPVVRKTSKRRWQRAAKWARRSCRGAQARAWPVSAATWPWFWISRST